MYNELIFMQLAAQNYLNNPEYNNLNAEEKACMDYVDECLSIDDTEFSDACTRIMLLIVDVSSKMDTLDEIPQDELNQRKEEILSKFNAEDRTRLESFMYSLIQTMGIYSDESIMQRRLNRERNE